MENDQVHFRPGGFLSTITDQRSLSGPEFSRYSTAHICTIKFIYLQNWNSVSILTAAKAARSSLTPNSVWESVSGLRCRSLRKGPGWSNAWRLCGLCTELRCYDLYMTCVTQMVWPPCLNWCVFLLSLPASPMAQQSSCCPYVSMSNVDAK